MSTMIISLPVRELQQGDLLLPTRRPIERVMQTAHTKPGYRLVLTLNEDKTARSHEWRAGTVVTVERKLAPVKREDCYACDGDGDGR